MKSHRAYASLATLLTLSACGKSSSPPVAAAPAPLEEPMVNPLLEPTWSTPFGVPPFDQISEDHYAPAFEASMSAHLAEIAAITGNAEAPTFANTMEALERSGASLKRVASVFFNLEASDSTEGLRKIRETYAPRLAQHQDAILLDAAVFARLKTLHERRAELGLRPDQLRLLTETYDEFVRSGANLDAAGKKRLTEINTRLAELFTAFGNRVREEVNHYTLFLDNETQTAGLPPEVLATAAETAKERGQPGKWAFTLVRSSFTPFMQYAKDRELRLQLYGAYISQGAHGDERDTRALLLEIARLRGERATLLGFADHATYQIAENMAKTPAAARGLLMKLWPAALAKAAEERAAFTALLRKELGRKAKLEPWDWWFYAEKVRQQRYALSEEELKPYFEVSRVVQGAFETAERLFGITFKEITAEVPLYHPQARAFEVTNADGSHVGVLYVDYFPRAGKRTGAWMTDFRAQSNLDGRVRPVIVNIGNFPAPAGDNPALLDWDEVETLFHEFGHALHGLLSDVTYESQGGTNVKRDFVEFPSQILENWAAEPAVLREYARHYKTNEPIPDALIEKLKKAETFNQGFATTELVAASLLDLAWHTLPAADLAKVTDVGRFDSAQLTNLGLIPEIGPRYHSPYFQHIFSSDGYAAGYYVYLWAEVLEADAFAAFVEKGDPFDPVLGQKLRQHIFSAGSSDDEMTQYRAFRGRDPDVKSLLKKRGLTVKP